MKNILFIAPPAGGKGTQSEALQKNLGYVHISTGDLLRNLDKSTPIGREVDELLSQGKLAPDEIVYALLKEKLLSIGNAPFILDGVPRHLGQVEEVEKILHEIGKSLDLVIVLDVPYQVALERAIGRISCPKCKSIFNKFFKQPVIEGICDKCGEELISRTDDDEETFKVRYDTYLNSTEPLIEFYKEKGKLVSVDGINNTYEKIVSVIKNDQY